MMQELISLADASRRYGADPAFVFGGGGNTSFKTASRLYIKPSGVRLSEIQPDDFIEMDRAAIRKLFDHVTPADATDREKMAKDAMAAAVCGQPGRPSVEAPLHELLPQAYVIHLHPAQVNGLTCSVEAAAACARLFPQAMWVDYLDPGYTLAKEMRQLLATYVAEHKVNPQIILLQNHGIFVAADSLEEIHVLYRHVMRTLEDEYVKTGIPLALQETAPSADLAVRIGPRLRSLLGENGRRKVVRFVGGFEPAKGPLSPDHMVYAKSFPLTEDPTAESVNKFCDDHGYLPVVCRVDGAVFCAASDPASLDVSADAVRDAALVQQLAAAFGGPHFLNDRQRSFIENWEVESYRRKKMQQTTADSAPLKDKIALVTGAAQGFGRGIAEGLVQLGASVIVVDLNEEGARTAARELEQHAGRARAWSIAANVADEDSVEAMAQAVAARFGGLDLLISNAGVLRAGSVKSLAKSDWDLVTAVNYTGYFLCVKHCSPLLSAMPDVADETWTDIIQINSKSGLQGSNRNAAYAGGKFGGIGLTQSFALELVDSRIKVNSICPGNFFDGPLWADPQNGLFVQYLKAGKVPGAETVEDVRAFYEAKVPMGRGCTPEDVLRAILYCVEQKYETGQAIPVTGGQVMLN